MRTTLLPNWVLAASLFLTLSYGVNICYGQSQVPLDGYPPPEVLYPPPSVDSSICVGEAPEGFHYELDQSCIDNLFAPYISNREEIDADFHRAKEAARQALHEDIEHADEQLESCTQAAGDDAEGIAECEAWHAIEIASAESAFEGAISGAAAVRDAAVSNLDEEYVNDAKECCTLVADPVEPERGSDSRVSSSLYLSSLFLSCCP